MQTTQKFLGIKLAICCGNANLGYAKVLDLVLYPFPYINCVIFTCDDTVFHDGRKAYYIEASNSSHNTNIVYFIVVSMTTEYLEAKKQVKKSIGWSCANNCWGS